MVRGEIVGEALVVVVHGHRQDLLGMVLSDNMRVEVVVYLRGEYRDIITQR